MAVNKFTRLLPILVIGLAMMSATFAPTPPECACKPREVGASGSRNDWEGYRKGGIAWHYSVDEAMQFAAAEKKLVFWYHVAGDLDKEGC